MPAANDNTSCTRRQLLQYAAAAGLVPVLPAETESPGAQAALETPERLAAKIAANQSIQRARAAALDILKPTQRDLQHGMELHGRSIVFDAYAFAPQAAVDGAVLAKGIDEGASEIELQDLTENMM